MNSNWGKNIKSSRHLYHNMVHPTTHGNSWTNLICQPFHFLVLCRASRCALLGTILHLCLHYSLFQLFPVFKFPTSPSATNFSPITWSLHRQASTDSRMISSSTAMFGGSMKQQHEQVLSGEQVSDKDTWPSILEGGGHTWISELSVVIVIYRVIHNKW